MTTTRRVLPLAAVLLATSAAIPAWPQGVPQTISQLRVNVAHMATGYRASKITHSSVYNSGNEKIGTVDDLIIDPDDRVLYAILSVGGFLGVGTHLIVLPYEDLKITNSKIVLPGATREALKSLPEFKYSRG